MQQRYYDPLTQRFDSVDPVSAYDNGDMRLFNRYAYAFNNPYKFDDADGRAPCDYCKEVGERVQKSIDSGIFHVAGNAIATDVAFVVGAVTGNEALKSAAADGFQEKVGTRNAVEAVVSLGMATRGGVETPAATGAVDFVVTPGGTAFPVPKGATGPTPSTNQAGRVTGAAFTGGKGGANGQVASMRIMDPNTKNPSGYIKYENSAQPKPQGVDPYSGRTVPPEKAHFPIDK